MRSTGVMTANGTVEVFPRRELQGLHFHHFIMYEFLLCSAVSLALGALTLWHARLISRGETSIEVHINKKEKKRMDKQGMVSCSDISLHIKVTRAQTHTCPAFNEHLSKFEKVTQRSMSKLSKILICGTPL